jgi:hypothetical protein
LAKLAVTPPTSRFIFFLFRYFRSGADVTFHLFAVKKDEKRIRSILSKWADRGYIANLTVADKEFVFRPLLDLQVSAGLSSNT